MNGKEGRNPFLVALEREDIDLLYNLLRSPVAYILSPATSHSLRNLIGVKELATNLEWERVKVLLEDNLRPVPVGRVLRGCVGEWLVPEASANTITWEVRPAYVSLVANASEHMLSNAKFVGAKVSFAVCQSRYLGECLLLVDDGPGMPKQIFSSLGKRRVTTKSKGHGVGTMTLLEEAMQHGVGLTLVQLDCEGVMDFNRLLAPSGKAVKVGRIVISRLFEELRKRVKPAGFGQEKVALVVYGKKLFESVR